MLNTTYDTKTKQPPPQGGGCEASDRLSSPSPKGRPARIRAKIAMTGASALLDRKFTHALLATSICPAGGFPLLKLLFRELHSRASMVMTNAIDPSTTAIIDPRKSHRTAKYTEALAEHIMTALAM